VYVMIKALSGPCRLRVIGAGGSAGEAAPGGSGVLLATYRVSRLVRARATGRMVCRYRKKAGVHSKVKEATRPWRSCTKLLHEPRP
jgi:hypothetical protein